MSLLQNFVWFSFLCANLALTQRVDLTRNVNVGGTEVVNAVIGILRQSCLFDDNLLYLRRVAYVDSHDGRDPDTYTTGFKGGIWNIDEVDFNSTLDDPDLQKYRDAINKNLFIDWSGVTYSDLRRPLFSALATELFAISQSGKNGIPLTVETQSVLWSNNGNKSPNDFVKAVYELENGFPVRQNLDVAFLLDSSASMSKDDFNKAKEFVKSFVSGLDVNSGVARVAVVEYSTVVYPILGLDNNQNETTLIDSINNISYKPGGTHTYEAIKYVQENVFKVANGSRSNAAKVVVIVTDGRSDDNIATINAARDLRAQGVTIYAVGVGSLIDDRELSLVVSQPSCSHIQRVGNYSDLPSDSRTNLQLVTQSPVVLRPGTYTFDCGSDISANVLRTVSGKTIEISVDDGELAVFGSGSNAFLPGTAIYSFNETVTRTKPLNIYVRDGSQILLAVRNMSTGGCATQYHVKITDGNSLKMGSEFVCVEAGLISKCTQKDLSGSPFIHLGTPDPSLSSLCTGTDTFVASYPGFSDRYLSCNSGILFVVLCPAGQGYSITSFKCVDLNLLPTTQKPTTPAPTTVAATTAPVVTAAPTTPECTAGMTGFFPNQNDRYKICVAGRFQVAFCQQGYVFDINVDRTRCVKVVAASTAKPAPVTTVVPVQTNAPTNPAVTAPASNPCTPEHIQQGLFIFAYPQDNTKFIKCSTFPFTGTILDCEEHKYFSPSVGNCLYLDVVVNPTNQTFVTDFPNPCIKNYPGDVQYHPYPGNPYKFIQCDAFGDAFVKDCDLGEVWEQDILNCIPTGFKYETAPPLVG
ncbi:hypothetical protein ACF0H5_021238 [Mactra antiquata]